MGIIEDAYKILKDTPGALDAIGENLTAFYKSSFWKRLFGSKPTLAQKKTNLAELIGKVSDDTFAGKQVDHHAYLAALMALAAGTAELAARGAVLEDFFLPGYRFYYPPPSGDVSLNKVIGAGTIDVAYSLPYTDKGNAYLFYAVKCDEAGRPTAADLQARISTIARSNPADGEKSTVIEELKKSGHEIVEIKGIAKATDGSIYFSRTQIPDDIRDLRSLGLNFTRKGTRQAIVRDLREAINFKLIP